MSPQYDNFTFTCKLDLLWQQLYKWLFCRSHFFRKWSSSYRYWCTPIGFLNYNFTTSQFRDWKDAVKKACSHTLFRKLKAEGGSFPFSYLCWVCHHCLVEPMEPRLALQLPEQKRPSSPCRRSASWTPPRIESWSRSCPCPRSWCCPRCSSTLGCWGTSRPCQSHLSCWVEKNEFNIITF